MIDLHLHLDGSLSESDLIRLADISKVHLPLDYKEHLHVTNDCQSLNQYLECFETPLLVLQNEKAISESVRLLLKKLANQGLIYAEIRFAPQLHCENGLSQREVVKAAIKGLEASPIKAGLILCLMRSENNYDENMETVRIAKEFLYKGVVAIDLAGAEGIYETSLFRDFFLKAKELEIPFTIHAGEASGPDSIYEAIKFGAERIGHGTHAMYSNKTMELLNIAKTVVEMCPSSNIQTKSIDDLKDYPLRLFMNSNIKVTINTDNMSVSNTTIVNEFKLMIEYFQLTKNEIYMLLSNACEGAFQDAKTKLLIKSDLDKKFDSWYESNF